MEIQQQLKTIRLQSYEISREIGKDHGCTPDPITVALKRQRLGENGKYRIWHEVEIDEN